MEHKESTRHRHQIPLVLSCFISLQFFLISIISSCIVTLQFFNGLPSSIYPVVSNPVPLFPWSFISLSITNPSPCIFPEKCMLGQLITRVFNSNDIRPIDFQYAMQTFFYEVFYSSSGFLDFYNLFLYCYSPVFYGLCCFLVSSSF